MKKEMTQNEVLSKLNRWDHMSLYYVNKDYEDLIWTFQNLEDNNPLFYRYDDLVCRTMDYHWYIRLKEDYNTLRTVPPKKLVEEFADGINEAYEHMHRMLRWGINERGVYAFYKKIKYVNFTVIPYFRELIKHSEDLKEYEKNRGTWKHIEDNTNKYYF